LTRSAARPLLTPLRASILLHAIVLGVIVYCLPPATPPGPDRTLQVRLAGEAAPDDERRFEDDVWLDEQAEVREHALDLPDFDVLLPPADVEERSEGDVLPEQTEPAPAATEAPLETFHVPAGAGRKPAPQPIPTPTPTPTLTPPKPRARPSPRAKPQRRRGVRLRVIRRPGMRGHYPREARRRGLEGTVMVFVRVAASGQVVTARVRKSSGHASLDAAALEVARLYEFAPGTPGRALLPVRFRLTDVVR